MYTPYPFERLPKFTRVQARTWTQLHSLFSDTDLARAQHEVETLLGLPLAWSAGVPSACFGADVAARTEAVWIELAVFGSGSGANSAWLELPLGLCELAIDRALGGDAERGLLASVSDVDEFGLGALAYLTARACAVAGPRFRVLGVRLGPPSLADAAFLRAPVTLATPDEAAIVQFYAPGSVIHDAAATRTRRRSLSGLELGLWAHAGSALLDLATLRSLCAGDVVVLQRTGLAREHAEAEFQGSVDVRVDGSASVLHCVLRAGRLEVETIACSAEPGMTSGRRIFDAKTEPSAAATETQTQTQTLERPADRGPRADLARDAPIEVALEIARFQLRLQELEAIGPGDVLATGRRIGESVTLRAANQVFAEGELVDVEGELGVRITRILVP
jgi:type III secretion system YscQ/HrcQ family protein